MRLQIDTGVGIGALLALQLVTSFSAIGLLARTGPAIEQILEENVASNEAIEEMLSILVTRGERADFDAALARATNRASDPVQHGLLERVEFRADAALAGDASAEAEVVSSLREVAASSRAHMRASERAARFVARAGAWAAAFLGAGGFWLSILVYRRMKTRLERPVLELDRALMSVRAGDLRRRCPSEGPAETRRIAENANWLIDRLEFAAPQDGKDQDRGLLVAVLDRWTEPALIVDDNGRAVVVNRAGMETWADGGEETAALGHALRDGEPPPTGWVVERIEPCSAWLCKRA